uniref:Acid phosphatase/vanadium-dependent haloperoxidase-related protein n=1 Tax=Solanum tuberosum TaxID=4113 RepID=M1B541_SOLTU
MNEVLTASDASSSARSYASSISPVNVPLFSALLACAIAQFLKLFTTWYKEKRWDSKRMLSSGGMPSSHSATVTSLIMAIYLQEGAGGSVFAIAVVLACVRDINQSNPNTGTTHENKKKTTFSFSVYPRKIPDDAQVMYDATGVRLHAGRQAELLNQIVCELPPEHPVANVRPLRDSLGHTPLQIREPKNEQVIIGSTPEMGSIMCESKFNRTLVEQWKQKNIIASPHHTTNLGQES